MQRIFRFLEQFEKNVMMWSGLILMSLLVASVLMRYVFNTDLYGIEEFQICFAFWLYFMASAYCSNKNIHITADILNFIVKNNILKVYIKMIVNLFTSLICSIFAYWSINFLSFAIVNKQRSMVWYIPHAIFYMAVVLGLFLMALHHFFIFIETSRLIKNRIEVIE